MEIYSPTLSSFWGFMGVVDKIDKNLMFKVLDRSHLTFEEMYSVLTRVEACLNSRPLTPLSSCPKDLAVQLPYIF